MIGEGTDRETTGHAACMGNLYLQLTFQAIHPMLPQEREVPCALSEKQHCPEGLLSNNQTNL